jgi:hypothetical protein
MSPQEICDECRQWAREQAEFLPAEVGALVRRALEEKHEALCCVRLYEIDSAYSLPDPWGKMLDRFWDNAR